MSDVTRQRNLVFSRESVISSSMKILLDNLDVISDSTEVSSVVNQEADEIAFQIEVAQRALVAALNRGARFVNRNA